MLLKMRDVSERLNISLSAAYQLASEGRLPVIATGPRGKAYRIDESDLLAFMAANKKHKGRSSKAEPGTKCNPRAEALLRRWAKDV